MKDVQDTRAHRALLRRCACSARSRAPEAAEFAPVAGATGALPECPLAVLSSIAATGLGALARNAFPATLYAGLCSVLRRTRTGLDLAVV